MAGVRFTELQSRPMEFLDFTSVTLDEFQQLVPPFETAFQCHMVAWRMDGKPRTARRFTVYKTCPLPTPEERLLFILTYVKTYTLQVVQGRLFGMVQSKANRWMHVLLPVLLAALRSLGDAPARSVAALAERLGVSEANAATVVTPLEEAAAAEVVAPVAAPASPLLCELARKKENPSLTAIAQFIAVCRRSKMMAIGTRRPPRGSRLCRRWALKWRDDGQLPGQC